ncbi:hypothetical protein ONO39_25195, partial [Salmonella enterica subsp. enterica serovar Anatum]|nr:hypothetical protein [Salmonella enterica subsp. enterica serovar Anatum]
LGFSEPVSLNTWPIACSDGQLHEIKCGISSNSGETLKQLCLNEIGRAHGYQLFKENKCATCHGGIILGGRSFEPLGLKRDFNFGEITAA